MSLPVSNSTSNLYSIGTAAPSLNLKKKIGSITAEEINVLAKAMITRLMLNLNIDIEHADASTTKFDANSKMFGALLDSFTPSIKTAFSTRNLFIKLNLFATDKSGILDQIADEGLKVRINEAHQTYQLLDITLSASSQSNRLCFDITTLGNLRGNLLYSSNVSNSIDRFEALLKNGEVF